MSLANKYRPKIFDEVIGQEHITNILKYKLKNGKGLNSNFLFYGPRGTGKTTCARILAKGLNCLNPKDGNPCNECENCKLIDSGNSIDYVEIDAASHTGVDNIREEILDKINYPPTSLKKKVYVIDEVHMLSKGAFNALLKTIEEPKENVVFILATTEIHKIPDTIISRCQVFNFKKVSEDKIVERLEYICKQENFDYEVEALKMIAEISEGCVRDAVKYLDQVSILDKISVENVTKFLSIVSQKDITEFLELLKHKDIKVFEFLDNLNSQGVDFFQFGKQILSYIDKNFDQNIEFYSAVVNLFSQIFEKIKIFPYQHLVYKMVIGDFFNFDTANLSSNISNKRLSSEKNLGKNKEEFQEKKNTDKNGSLEISENSDLKESKDFPQEIDDVAENQAEVSVSKKNGEEIDLEALEEELKKRIEQEGKKMLLSAVKNSKLKLQDGEIVFETMSAASKTALNSKNNKLLLEKLIFEILGKNYPFKVVLVKKEDLLNSLF